MFTINCVLCTDFCDHCSEVNLGGFIPNAAKNRPHVRSIRSARLFHKRLNQYSKYILLTQYPSHH